MWLNLAWFLAGVVGGGAGAYAIACWRRPKYKWLATELKDFFRVEDAARVQVRRRGFPQHMAPDAKLGLDQWLRQPGIESRLIGVPITSAFMSEVGIASLLSPRGEEWYQAGSVEYDSYDVGDEQTIECPRHALWLVKFRGAKLAVLWTSNTQHSGSGFVTRLTIEIGFLTAGDAEGEAEDLLRHLEHAVNAAGSYRGRILSLEREDDYSGNKVGLTVHRLRSVSREDVILPDSTVSLLERNLIRFVEQRETLSQLGMPTKKGLLFYGPPGTGKTHTIHYLVGALDGHTTLLITAEQIGNLAEYMTLARLLQPCLVVIEDVDLIAQDRAHSGVCEQSVLNRLLNEMDGLREDASIIFVMTTNRPQALETALAARPGRIDQAVEFPLPDGDGRERLIRLYACGAKIASDVVADAVRLTEGVSASFIKELMRRAVQFHLECRPNASAPEILRNDVDQAIEEMLWSGGALNRLLLGAGEELGSE
jgi:cell division protease FtsH